MKVEFFTFNDLHFREHPLAEYGYYATHAVLDLPDGHQVSVITGKHAYHDSGSYEVAVFCPNGNIASDVHTYMSRSEINALLKQVHMGSYEYYDFEDWRSSQNDV